MDLEADTISVAGQRSPLLQTTSFVASSARVTTVLGDPGFGQVALALALGGRVPLRTGHVLLDGVEDPALQRRAVALVDVPGVSAPEGGLHIRDVLSEELAFAGRPSGREAVAELLARCGATAYAGERFEDVPPPQRIRLLTTAAAERADARVLVVANPDRRGGEPREWWPHLEALAADGLTVIAQITHATARELGVNTRYELGVRA